MASARLGRAPPTTPSDGGCGRTPQFPQQRGFRESTLGCRFQCGIVFFCYIVTCFLFLFLFVFFSSRFFGFFSLLGFFFPHIPPLLLLLFVVLYQITITFWHVRWRRRDGKMDSVQQSSGLGQALMNGSLAGNAKGITGSFFWVASIDFR